MSGRTTFWRGLVGAACLFGLWAPSASAVAPANDDFEDRQVLAGSLPIAESGSNVEATKETEEPAPEHLGFAATGHSVWYEWEATSSGFVTVSTCGSTLDPVLGVYTGTALGALTEVAGDFASLGPDCAPNVRGAAVTFRAVSGVTYEIVVDGIIDFPGSELPGQGDVELELALTPQPVNDDFADATMLTGNVGERVYSAGASGFTWNATKEVGEPPHAGDPGGASVWYSWTAPSSENYGILACGRFEKTLLGVYTGNSPSALTPVASDDHSCSLLRFGASQGTTYRIAVDGKLDGETGSALMGSISVNVFHEPPSPRFEEESPPLFSVSRPDTAIRRKILRPGQRHATFAFGSSESGLGFRCKLDRRAFAGCSSPKTYRHLSPGGHVFEVVAVGPTGNADLSPATSRFRIPKADAALGSRRGDR